MVTENVKHTFSAIPFERNAVETSGWAHDIANLNLHHLHMSGLTLILKSRKPTFRAPL